MDSYQLWKTLHVTSAVLLVGNVTVTGFWAWFLYRQRREVGFRAIARGIMLTDIIFTLVGGAGLTITGILMVRAQQVSIMEHALAAPRRAHARDQHGRVAGIAPARPAPDGAAGSVG